MRCGKALLRVLKNTGAAILDLTLYEVCNAFWKECAKLGRIDREEAELACRVSKELSKYLTLYRVSDLDLEHVMEIAIENNVSFYDSSYIALAQKLRASIASEDSDILRVAPRYRIEVGRLSQLLELCRAQ